MRRGLSGHGVPQGSFALAAPHDFRGDKLHVGHARLGGGGGSAQLHLFELRIVDPLLHLVVRLLDAPEL